MSEPLQQRLAGMPKRQIAIDIHSAPVCLRLRIQQVNESIKQFIGICR